MPKRRSSSSGGQASRLLWLLAGLALVIFLGGECFAYLGSDSGRLALFRTTHLGDHAHVVRVVGKHLHAGLKAARGRAVIVMVLMARIWS